MLSLSCVGHVVKGLVNLDAQVFNGALSVYSRKMEEKTLGKLYTNLSIYSSYYDSN